MIILQWNVNGFHTRFENINLILNDIDPLCLYIQETNFKNNYCAKLKNYDGFHKNRIHSNIASGGVVTYVKSCTLPKTINISSSLEVVAVKIKFPLAVTICTISLTDLDDVNNQLPIPFILLGDFNSHRFLQTNNKSTNQTIVIGEEK